MLRWVKVEEVGDTEFLIDEQVDKFVFQEENVKVVEKGGKPAKARPLLLGHHQERPEHGQLHLGRLLPGDDPGPDRGLPSTARSTTCAA